MCRTSVHSHFFFIANTSCEIVPFGLLLLLLSHFSRVRLCDPIDGSPPGSAVPGILQAGTLEWVAISFSNARKWKVKVKSLSRVRPLATRWTAAYHAPPSIGLSRQEYWSGVPLKGYIYLLSVFRYVFHFVRQSVQFCSVAQSCPTLCNLMDCSMPGFPVHHQLPQLAQTHVH